MLLSKNTGVCSLESPQGKDKLFVKSNVFQLSHRTKKRERQTERQIDRERENVVYFGLYKSSLRFQKREDHMNAVYAK